MGDASSSIMAEKQLQSYFGHVWGIYEVSGITPNRLAVPKIVKLSSQFPRGTAATETAKRRQYGKPFNHLSLFHSGLEPLLDGK